MSHSLRQKRNTFNRVDWAGLPMFGANSKFKISRTRSIHSFVKLTPRSWSKVTFSLIDKVIDFTSIEKILHRLYKSDGRPPYSKLANLKAVLLQRVEGWQYDTTLVQKLHDIKEYRQFCGYKLGEAPSHDTISRFKRTFPVKMLDQIFFRLDKELAALGTFKGDELAIDATDITSHANPFKRTDAGAGVGHKSIKKHFYGYWELFTVGTKSELVRLPPLTSPGNRHQINQMGDLLLALPRYTHLDYNVITADGIFDTKPIQQYILDDLHKLPVINYNPRGSRYRRLEDLPKENWHFFNPLLADLPRYYATYNARTAVERFNGRFKDDLHSRHSNVRGLENNHKFVYFGILSSQLKALTLQYLIQSKQKTFQLALSNFMGGTN